MELTASQNRNNLRFARQPFSGRRFYSFSSYLRKRFGGPVRKITIDAGFDCPNRDGTLGEKGCIYCNNRSFSPALGRPGSSVSSQIEAGKKALVQKHDVRMFIAYFQPYTNTYAPLETLKRLYDEAVRSPGVVGLSIGTRPDCVPDDVLGLLASYASEHFDVWLELGLQSADDRTLQRINRAHTLAQFLDAVVRAKRFGLKICAHVILGLPGEGDKEVRKTAEVLCALDMDGVKIHPLHVVKDTVLAEMYREGGYVPLRKEDYVWMACDFLERISPRTVVQRLTGEASSETLIAPSWCKEKASVIQAIEKEMERRDSFQGKHSSLYLSIEELRKGPLRGTQG